MKDNVDSWNLGARNLGAWEPGNLAAKPVIQLGKQSRRFIAEPVASVWQDARRNFESWLQKVQLKHCSSPGTENSSEH